ncbi:hypothetical protein CDL15_Pgr002877 [Punica granatum]|uniref:Bifunctional riboflavin kinase/FMN phosphatase-like n=1 Tax=Punica granatum TaxID=22663 RepID=A0A218X1Y0_PUNGR|nr:hypothetical protein CDL15_Pgr002877 [Punica granatum]
MSCCACKRRNAISAVILDLDGTLVDTENGSKGVLKEFLAKHGRVLNEGNKRLGKTLKESAISIVEDYDLPLTPDQFIQEITPMYREKWLQAKPLPGSNRLIKHLHKHGVPFALASNSLRDYIDAKIANQDGWKESFSAIIGSDDVESGKPSPDMVGVKGAKAANMKVMAVPSHEEADSSSMADAVINTLLEFQPEIWGLPPFDDWVQNALPIERIYLSCRNISGFLHEMKEDGKFGLTNQTSGIFFGWAQVSLPKTFKAVVAIGFHSPNNTRKLVSDHL